MRMLMYVEDRPYAFLELEVRFEILEVYSGSLYEDTCLTGLVLEFTGRFAH